MFTITKQFSFSASHVLNGLPEGHQCGRLHGHNYRVELVLGSYVLDLRGFVYDYGDLAPFAAWIEKHVEHKHLNEALPYVGGPAQPSAENLAAFFFVVARNMLGDRNRDELLLSVRVSETEKTWAEYSPLTRAEFPR